MHARLQSGQGELVLEVDVGNDRDRRARHDLRKSLCGLHLVARAAHDVAPVGGK